jgi:DNA-binding NarL/FixJ family response regulator
MPGMAVVDLIRALRSAGRSPRILVLSVHPERLYARRVLQAGADGYLTKSHSPTALAEAIRQVHAGRKYVTPALAEELAVSLSEGSALPTHEALSNREYEVFRRLGAGVRVNEIALELALSPKTVRTYRSRILEKMNIGSTAELIFYAVRNGLVGDVPTEDLSEDSAPDATSRRSRRRAAEAPAKARS